MEFLPVAVQQGEYLLRVYAGPLVKGPIRKPWVEPGYMYLDVRLETELMQVTLTDFELELDWENGFLRIGIYTGRKKQNNYFDLKDYRAKERIKTLLGITQENFEPVFLFKELYEELLIYFKKQNRTESLYLYQPFILKGAPVVLVSPMGMGKTLFSLWLSLRIANGLPMIQWESPQIFNVYTEEVFYYEPEPKKVLYLCFEGNEQEIFEKKQQIMKGLEDDFKAVGKETKNDISIQFLEPLSQSVARKEMRRFLSYVKPDLVVIDSVTSALLGFPELKQAEFIFNYIATNLTPRGIATLLIMHPSKDDLREDRMLPKGSILYLSHPRIVWGLTRTFEIANGFQLELKPIKENLGLKRTFFRFNTLFHVDKIEIKYVEKVEKSSEEMKVSELCYEYLLQKEVATPEEIAKYYQINYDVVKITLSRMAERGEIVKISRGKYALSKEVAEKEKKIDEFSDDKIPF